MTIEKIKNDYIRDKYLASHALDTWLDFQNFFANRHPEWFELHWEEVMRTYAMECLKLASENSKVLVEGILTEERKTLFTLFDKGIKGVVQRKVSVCRESITNENNIIK